MPQIFPRGRLCPHLAYREVEQTQRDCGNGDCDGEGERAATVYDPTIFLDVIIVHFRP